VIPPLRGHPVGVPYIAGVPLSEGHFNDKRPNGSQKCCFRIQQGALLDSPHLLSFIINVNGLM
jgi:hypothetical protein